MGDKSSHKCLIIACGAIAGEIVQLQRQLSYSKEAFTLKCLPADYHNTPQKIAPAIEKILMAQRDQFDVVLVGYGDCGTGGKLDAVLEKYDASRLPGAHCYEFFAGAQLFGDIIEEELGSFFVTDYLVKFFDRLVIKGLGLDRYPHLYEIYFANYKRVVYLAQEDNPILFKKAQAAAHKLGLQFHYQKVGYGDLEIALKTFPLKTVGAHNVSG